MKGKILKVVFQVISYAIAAVAGAFGFDVVSNL